MARHAAPPCALYTVTTFPPKESDPSQPDTHRHSTVACCMTLERAREIVEANEVDIHETTDDFVVIERGWSDSAYGLGPQERGRWWYRWEGQPDKGHYVASSEPTDAELIVCWAGF